MTQLTQFRDRLADRLSGGMKPEARVGCTLVLTSLILLDEPTTGVGRLRRRSSTPLGVCARHHHPDHPRPAWTRQAMLAASALRTRTACSRWTNRRLAACAHHRQDAGSRCPGTDCGEHPAPEGCYRRGGRAGLSLRLLIPHATLGSSGDDAGRVQATLAARMMASVRSRRLPPSLRGCVHCPALRCGGHLARVVTCLIAAALTVCRWRSVAAQVPAGTAADTGRGAVEAAEDEVTGSPRRGLAAPRRPAWPFENRPSVRRSPRTPRLRARTVLRSSVRPPIGVPLLVYPDVPNNYSTRLRCDGRSAWAAGPTRLSSARRKPEPGDRSRSGRPRKPICGSVARAYCALVTARASLDVLEQGSRDHGRTSTTRTGVSIAGLVPPGPRMSVGHGTRRRARARFARPIEARAAARRGDGRTGASDWIGARSQPRSIRPPRSDRCDGRGHESAARAAH